MTTPVPNTVVLVAIAIGLVGGLPLGILAGWHSRRAWSRYRVRRAMGFSITDRGKRFLREIAGDLQEFIGADRERVFLGGLCWNDGKVWRAERIVKRGGGIRVTLKNPRAEKTVSAAEVYGWPQHDD